MNPRSALLAELERLAADAERTGEWLHCTYQDLWFSPTELREANAEGRFLWGACNWTIRDPMEHLNYLTNKAVLAKAAVAVFMKRMA